jgi:hypothetical protein
MDPSKFSLGDDGRIVLSGDWVRVENESKIFRKGADGEFQPFAWNPWPQEGTSNQYGDFRFQGEERFPLFRVERDSDGKIILKDGLQVWTPNDFHLGMTTAFNGTNAVREAGESWAGRNLAWGQNGLLEIETQVFIDFNAFYSPSARMLFFGVVPYRLKGQTDVKIFETASSWDMVAHESGHALHHVLKPNVDQADQGYNIWGESFGDQTAMWASLWNQDRAHQLVAETNGDLNRSNSLSRMCEAFAALIGSGTGIRDAFNDKKVSDTTEEEHDRSEVFTGAAYKIFLTIYDELNREFGPEDALQQAGQIMGTFLTRAADFTPENRLTLEDVAKAYLKVDKEYFGSRYHNMLVDEFTRREIFDEDSVREWRGHEAAIPRLWSPPNWPEDMVAQMLQANLDALGIGPGFGLKLQSVTRVNSFGQFNQVKQLKMARNPFHTIVRVQLTLGRDADAQPLENHGVLVFDTSGLLIDFNAPLPSDDNASLIPDVLAQARALAKLGQAEQLRLGERGAPLSLVRKPDGQWTVEAHVLRGDGLNAWMEVFTLDNPRGERREILRSPLPPDKRIPIPDDLLK